MNIEFFAGLGAIITALVTLLGVIVKVGRAIVSLEEAVNQLKRFMENQAKKNSGFLKQIVEQERRIALLEAHTFSK